MKIRQFYVNESVQESRSLYYDEHFKFQSPEVQNRLNQQMRRGRSYPEAVKITKGATPLDSFSAKEEVDSSSYQWAHGKRPSGSKNRIRLTPGWADGSMKRNYGKVGNPPSDTGAPVTNGLPRSNALTKVQEDRDSVDAVAGAITRRIMMQHTDLLSKYGPVKVKAAIDDVADFAGSDGLDEIGSSDVSIWTKQVIQDLEAGRFDHMESVNEAEEDAVDTVTMDVPLLLRMMEYAREDAKHDIDLHDVAERMIAMSKRRPLSMRDYAHIVGSEHTMKVDENHLNLVKSVGATANSSETRVSFNQNKQMGDAALNISASAKDMEQLAYMLKLAGIDMPTPTPNVATEPKVIVDKPCGCDEPHVSADSDGVKYSADKELLINYLRKKLNDSM
jgi:hypothetical protein